MGEEEIKAHKFSKPLELKSPGRAKFVFRTFEDLDNWFNGETRAWKWLTQQGGTPGSNAWRHFSGVRRDLASHIARVKPALATGGLTREHEQNLRQALSQGQPIVSDSKQGKFILNLREEHGVA